MNAFLRYITLITVVTSVGCHFCPLSSSKHEIVYYTFQGMPKSEKEINDLVNASNNGNDDASFELHTYYSLGYGQDAELASYYFEIAINQENEDALYVKAQEIWDTERNPDVDLVYGLLKKAIEKGHEDNKRLFKEVEKAKETGIVPLQTKNRFFERN